MRDSIWPYFDDVELVNDLDQDEAFTRFNEVLEFTWGENCEDPEISDELHGEEDMLQTDLAKWYHHSRLTNFFSFLASVSGCVIIIGIMSAFWERGVVYFITLVSLVVGSMGLGATCSFDICGTGPFYGIQSLLNKFKITDSPGFSFFNPGVVEWIWFFGAVVCVAILMADEEIFEDVESIFTGVSRLGAYLLWLSGNFIRFIIGRNIRGLRKYKPEELVLVFGNETVEQLNIECEYEVEDRISETAMADIGDDEDDELSDDTAYEGAEAPSSSINLFPKAQTVTIDKSFKFLGDDLLGNVRFDIDGNVKEKEAEVYRDGEWYDYNKWVRNAEGELVNPKIRSQEDVKKEKRASRPGVVDFRFFRFWLLDKMEGLGNIFDAPVIRHFYPSLEIDPEVTEDDLKELMLQKRLYPYEEVMYQELELEYEIDNTDEFVSDGVARQGEAIDELDDEVYDDVGSNLVYDEEDLYDGTFSTMTLDEVAELWFIKIGDYWDMYVYDFPIIVGDDDGEGSSDLDEENETPILQRHYNAGATTYTYDLYILGWGFGVTVGFIWVIARLDFVDTYVHGLTS